MTKITMIVAMDQNRLIGYNNALPWHIPSEMKHFLQTVKGKPILVTGMTYDSLPKSFTDHHPIYVISRQHPQSQFQTLEQAIAYLDKFDEIMICGGSFLYQEGLKHATDVIVSEIKKKYEVEPNGTERYFPVLEEELWVDQVTRTIYDQKEDVDIQITYFKRRT